MENKKEIAKYLMEEGWKAREALEFDKAEALLSEARKEFEALEDWFNVTECLNHLSYLHKLKAGLESKKAVDMVRQSLRLAKEKGVKTALISRALCSVLDSYGAYEEAAEHALSYLEAMKKSAPRGDARVHIAKFKLRTGKLAEAKEEVENAIKEIEAGWDEERMPHKAVWMCSAFFVRSLVNFNLGNIEAAKDDCLKAEEYARESQNKTRLSQVEELKRFLLI